MSIASELQRLQQAKADIIEAIEAQGVTVPEGSTLDELAELIDEIEGGGGGGFPYPDPPVTDMSGWFWNSQATSLDLRNIITRDVTNMSRAFHGMQNLVHLDLTCLDLSNVTNVHHMFASNIYNLKTIDISHWDTSKVTGAKMTFMSSSSVEKVYFRSTEDADNLADGFTPVGMELYIGPPDDAEYYKTT